MEDIYSRYGKKQEQLEVAIEQHQQTLALLRAIKTGEVTIEQVDVRDNGWRLLEPAAEVPENVTPIRPEEPVV